MTPRITDVGLSGMLVTFADSLSEGANRAALAFRAAIDGMDGVQETTTSLTSTFVVYNIPDRDAVRARLVSLIGSRDWSTAPLPEGRTLWRVPSVFDGPQLSEAAALAGVTEAQAVAEICATPLRVMTLGFAPGQPYLGTLPAHWDIPRQTGLTREVPVGAITVAVRQIVLFAVASPTGWRQVGRCGLRPFQPEAEAPFLLKPGDELLFVASDHLDPPHPEPLP